MLLEVCLIVVVLAAALAAGRLTRRHLPELVSWLVVGALLGPSGMALIPRDEFDHLRPVIQVATAVLMFLVGERLSLQALRPARWVVVTALASYLSAGVVVYGGARLAGADETLSLLLGTLAGGGAPMTVAALVGGRRSAYRDGLVAFHACCDLLAAVVFATMLPAVVLVDTPGRSFGSAARSSLQLGLAGAAVGAAAAVSLSVAARRSTQGRAVAAFVVGHIAVAVAVCLVLGLSIPLCGLVMGAVTATRMPRDLTTVAFRSLGRLEFPLYLLFFTLAGAAIRLGTLPRLGLVGVAYVAGRTGAKAASGAVAARACGFSPGRAAAFGLDSLPQAGVAVALAAVGSAALPGRGIATITLGSIIVFETAGAAIVSRNLDRHAEPGLELVRPAA
ncbi:MAG TPA: cation:proton antiporter [Gaiellaceae bacterium]|nr:cation:proton antiporter [Gaiellaceae bacterium]HUJ56288.1 cation:proton antiporter [Gaiellaceae bacterium]